jgi:hypothetical protein
MDERWYMLLHTTNDSWSWCVVGTDGAALQCAAQRFARYIDAYEDAKQHGCPGTPTVAIPRESADGFATSTRAPQLRAEENAVKGLS